MVLQTFPRIFGFVFNPVSFWFCHDREGALRAVLAEVRNTFGDHHNYLVAHADGAGVTKDMVEAYKWTALASRRGVPEAGQFLAAMARDMNPDQIERAKTAADKFAPRR